MWEPRGEDSEEKLHSVGVGRGTEEEKRVETKRKWRGELEIPEKGWGEENFDGAWTAHHFSFKGRGGGGREL